MEKLHRNILISVAVLVALSSCGPSKQKVNVRDLSTTRSDSAKSGLVDDPNCTKTSCDPVVFSLVDERDRVFGSGVVLQGVLNKEVSWTINTVSKNAPAGRIRIALIKSPTWMQSQPNSEPGSLIISGVPNDVIRSDNIIILARDMNRCATKNSIKDCQDVTASFSDFDKSFHVEYSISR